MAQMHYCPNKRTETTSYPQHSPDLGHPLPALQIPVCAHQRDDEIESLKGPWIITRWKPPVDIEMKKDNLILTMDVPGVEAGSLEVVVNSGILTIQGNRQTHCQSNLHIQRTERQSGPFARSFQLPSSAQSRHLKATYLNGILRVVIPAPKQTEYQMRLHQDRILVRLI